MFSLAINIKLHIRSLCLTSFSPSHFYDLFCPCSLAPDYLTLLVAKQCVNHKVNLVVSTYLTPELQVCH